MRERVLYVAHRNDPRDIKAGSGADYQFYSSLIDQGFDVQLLGPFKQNAAPVERLIGRTYMSWSQKRYLKFPLSLMMSQSLALSRFEKKICPDVVFTLFPSSLVFYGGTVPCVYRSDATQFGWQQECQKLGQLALRIGMWQERKALRRSAAVITHSEWNNRILQQHYDVQDERVHVFPNPAALPESVIPSELTAISSMATLLKLLFVGRDVERKGLDIAIEVTNSLNQLGFPAHLVVCGLKGTNGEHVSFVGQFRKDDQKELQDYVDLYRESHLLLHPARFDPSPIVTSEAAAFGVPTITNDAGGISTSVSHMVSGIVLPKHSPPEIYVRTIVKLLQNEDLYQILRETTRERFETELNWQVAGSKIANILDQVFASQSK